MHGLSVSQAWEETKAILGRDGRLYLSVALGLIALPALISGLVNPSGMADSKGPLWATVVALIASLVTLAGQLGVVRLALGPSITVGGAIAHGIRRMPIYLVAAIIIVLGLMIAALPFAIALAAIGVPIDSTRMTLTPTPTSILFLLCYVALVLFVGVRMVLCAPVASVEDVGPLGLIKRSWMLTRGHFWKLLAFMLLFFIAAIILLMAIGYVTGLIVRLTLGPIDPMSLSALAVGLVKATLGALVTAAFGVMIARIYAQLVGRGQTDSGVPITGI